jgi:hypothetical protein
MKFEDLLMQQGDERQKRLDLEEEVRELLLIFLTWYLNLNTRNGM